MFVTFAGVVQMKPSVDFKAGLPEVTPKRKTGVPVFAAIHWEASPPQWQSRPYKYRKLQFDFAKIGSIL